MKKLIAAVFTAVLVAAGLVVSTGGTASADCSPSQYAGCVATKTKATGPGVVAKGKKARVCATVKAKGSNATPRGEVQFKVTRKGGGYSFNKTKNYRGGEVCVKTTKLTKLGGYSIKAKFKAPNTSIFLNSSDGAGFRVVS